MTLNAPHEMNHLSTRNGLEHWLCLVCGRHLLMRFWPKFFKRTIVAGDETVTHGGSRGGLKMGKVKINDNN